MPSSNPPAEDNSVPVRASRQESASIYLIPPMVASEILKKYLAPRSPASQPPFDLQRLGEPVHSRDVLGCFHDLCRTIDWHRVHSETPLHPTHSNAHKPSFSPIFKLRTHALERSIHQPAHHEAASIRRALFPIRQFRDQVVARDKSAFRRTSTSTQGPKQAPGFLAPKRKQRLLPFCFCLLLAFVGLLLSASHCVAFTISWDPSPGSNVLGHRVRYGTSSGNYTTTLDVGTATSAQIADPPAGVTYYAVVTAYAVASIESFPSAEVSFTSKATISKNADLAALFLNTAPLSPPFGSNTLSYTSGAANTTRSITVTPTVAQANATVRVNGSLVTSGSRSGEIILNVGSTNITVTVTAQNGIIRKNYTIAVTRAQAGRTRDLDGNGTDDLYFQGPGGWMAAWLMNGSGGVTSGRTVYSGSLGDWKCVGMADLNRDGVSDLIFQNDLGHIVVWYRNASGATIFPAYLYNRGLGDWKIVGVADMGGDGSPDLIFQNGIGQIAVWHLNGDAVVISTGFLFSAALGDWRVVSVVDGNGDGNADLIFQNRAGQIARWLMNGSGTVATSSIIYSGNLGDWKIRATADLNRDGIPDLVFQNSSGQVVGWLMNSAGGATGSLTIYNGTALGGIRLL